MLDILFTSEVFPKKSTCLLSGIFFFLLQSKTFGILLHGTQTISIAELKLPSAAEYISAMIGYQRQPLQWEQLSEVWSVSGRP